MKKVLAFGEILWDVIDGIPHLGGAPLNFAVHARKCGFESSMLAAVGDDELGKKAVSAIEKVDVDTSLIHTVEKKTGQVDVLLNQGQPTYKFASDTANDFLSSQLIDHDSIEGFDVFYFGTLAQRSEVTREALQNILSAHDFAEVFFDVNLREQFYSKEIIEESLKYCSIWKVNDEEVDVLGPLLFGESLSFDAFCSTVADKYPNIKIVIITAGADGCYVFSDGNLSLVGSEPITVADTVGAGDSFSAAFLASFFKYQDPIKAAEVANKVGGYVASQSGAIPEYSSELLQII